MKLKKLTDTYNTLYWAGFRVIEDCVDWKVYWGVFDFAWRKQCYDHLVFKRLESRQSELILNAYATTRLGLQREHAEAV